MAFGVSNSFKRGTVKTYSRQKARIEDDYDTDRPRKRIRMGLTGAVVEEILHQSVVEEAPKTQHGTNTKGDGNLEEAADSSTATPSSPTSRERGLFSSDALHDDSELSSLPSSPPEMLPSPRPTVRKPAFSFLKRKRCATNRSRVSEPLATITPNVCKAPPPAKRPMTQMQIDLGGEVRKTCRTCGMEYIPSVREDVALHKDFCAINVGGVDMGKGFSRDNSLRRVSSEKAMGSEREIVVVVDRKSSVGARNKVRKVLEVVSAELSAINIQEDRLWGALNTKSSVRNVVGGENTGAEEVDKRGDRFKAFLYLVEDKCVGFCLVEKINNAYPVVISEGKGLRRAQVEAPWKSSSVSVSNEAHIVLLGISRVWISKAYRGRGLATELLDCGRDNFFYGVEVPKNLVAFSQPTESGGRLATRWFDAETGWHVYRGEQ